MQYWKKVTLAIGAVFFAVPAFVGSFWALFQLVTLLKN
jgi:hypothetical protein